MNRKQKIAIAVGAVVVVLLLWLPRSSELSAPPEVSAELGDDPRAAARRYLGEAERLSQGYGDVHDQPPLFDSLEGRVITDLAELDKHLAGEAPRSGGEDAGLSRSGAADKADDTPTPQGAEPPQTALASNDSWRRRLVLVLTTLALTLAAVLLLQDRSPSP